MADIMDNGLKQFGVTVSKPILALVTILFGLLMIAFPEFLALLAGLYFIIQGVLLLADYFELRSKQHFSKEGLLCICL